MINISINYGKKNDQTMAVISKCVEKEDGELSCVDLNQ